MKLLTSLILLAALSVAAANIDNSLLTLPEARAYMLELINRDRATKSLPPVSLDPVANEAAQRHAEEMVRYRFLAHYNRAGKLPDQRYTEAGGTGYVQENVYLDDRHEKGFDPPDELTLQDPLFTRREIEDAEAAYFNQYPGRDGHRRNILNPHHTHVGIGLARAAADHARGLANAQEFVCADGELDPLPATANCGDKLTVRGVIHAPAHLVRIEVARFPLPEPLVRSQLMATRSYSQPAAYQTLDADDPAARIAIDPNGRFSCPVALSDEKQPGVYYIRIIASRSDGRSYTAAQRTVVVAAAHPSVFRE